MASRLQDLGYNNILGYNGFEVKDYPGWKNFPKLIKAGDSLKIEPRTHLDVNRQTERSDKRGSPDSVAGKNRDTSG